jgi:hypothetical protein
MKNYYQILDIPDNATDEEIKDAYTLAINYYKSSAIKNESLTGEKIEEIEEAYRILSNTESKNAYDIKRREVIDPEIQLTDKQKREQILLAREERLNNEYNELKEKIEAHKKEKDGFKNEKLQFADQNQRIRKNIKSIRISIIVISIIALGVTISTLIYSNSLFQTKFENQINDLTNTVQSQNQRIVLLNDSIKNVSVRNTDFTKSLYSIQKRKSDSINLLSQQLSKYVNADLARQEKARQARVEANRNTKTLPNNVTVKNVSKVELYNFDWGNYGHDTYDIDGLTILNKTNRTVTQIEYSYIIYDSRGRQLNSGKGTIGPKYPFKPIDPGMAKEVYFNNYDLHKRKTDKLVFTITNVHTK